MNYCFKNYDEVKNRALDLMKVNRDKFTLDKMTEKLDEIMEKYLKDAPQQVGLNLPKLKKNNIENLKNDFDILSVQRNLKILGIFVRLSKRDGKNNYLKFLPYTWALIQRRLKNPIFKNLNILMNKNLPIKKLRKLNKI